MIREMVLSRTYQLSSDTMDANAAADPSNRFLWRMNHKRLGARHCATRCSPPAAGWTANRPAAQW